MAKFRKNILLVTIFTILILISNATAACFQYSNANSQMLAYQAKKIYIDPALIMTAQSSHDINKKLPVIITFNEKTFEQDYNMFMDGFSGSVFVLKNKFSIIPGISGYIDKNYIEKLKTASVSLAVYENSNLSIQLRIKNNEMTSSEIKTSQTTNWWHDIIGLNNSTVALLDGTGIKVGILDTGIGYKNSSGSAIHVDLANKVVFSKNFAYGVSTSDTFDEFGHGTHVAGIIAGSGAASNGEYAGIAPGVSLYNLKVLNSSGSGNEDDIISAIQWSVDHNLDIINLSLGGGEPDPADPESLAVENAANHGVLVIMAEGNEGPKYFTGGSPAAAHGGIAVGAMNSESHVSEFSSRGPSLASVFEPDVVAPGEGIISTLGANSFIEKEAGFFGGTIPSNVSSGNNYVALDGTSMATPMVVGAAALILQKFPYLVPSMVKMGLMESARDLGYDPCTQGMGLINVPGAIAFLQKVQGNASIARIYPKNAPYAPYDLVNFPGSTEEILLKLLYKTNQVVHFYHINVTGITIKEDHNLIALDQSFGEKIVNFTIRSTFNATPGNYLIPILIKSAFNVTLDQVMLNITLQAPRFKIYLDSFHSVADTYPWTFPLSRIAMDYYPLIKNLSKSGVQVVTYMDYWSSGYNSTLAKSLLDYSWLCNFDAVIIPPLVTGLFQGEISALVKYHETGGHIIILGSRYQQFSYTSANELLNSLGMGVQFLPVDVENLAGDDLYNGFYYVPITNLTGTNFLNQGLSSITWVSGCQLESSNTHVSIVARDANGTGLIAMLPTMSGNGSIFVSGSESAFPVFYPISSSNEKFVQNLMAYYQGISNIRINGYLSNNTIFSGTDISVFFQAFNKTTGTYYTLNSSNVNCTLSNKTGIIRNITLSSASGPWLGNNSVVISTLANSSEPYVFTFNFMRANKVYHTVLAFFKYQAAGFGITMTLSPGDTLWKGQTLAMLFSRVLVNETMLITGIPLETFVTRQPFHKQQLVNSTSSISLLSTIDGLPAGLYFIDFMSISANGSYPYPLLERTAFLFKDHDPVINPDLSTVQGTTTFASTDSGNGYVTPVSVKTNQAVSIVVNGTDRETPVQNLSAEVTFYPICIINNEVHLMLYSLNLTMKHLTYNPTNEVFSGSITIPAEIANHQTITSSDYSGALIVILRDDDGGYDIFAIILNITAQFTMPLWLIVLLVISVPVVLVMVFYLVRRRRRHLGSQPTGQYGQSSRNTMRTTLNYCPYCGKYIQLKTRFCPYCGNEINIS